MNNTYISFLKYCLDICNPIPDEADRIDWNDMLVWAERQSIVGIVFEGIQRANKPLNIPYEFLLKWIGNATLIENRNTLLNKRCVEVVDYFKEKEFESCILKGQGNAVMYPNPKLRTPGDIDIWLMPKPTDRCKQSIVKKVIEHVKKRNPIGRAEYHHIDFGEFKGVEVEAHYRPTFMNNLITNRRLQRWMKERESEQFNNLVSLPGLEQKISVPTWDFNVVFQLSHIYRHVIQGGIGLRQIIDYYYLLKSEERSKKEDVTETLRYLGLYEIARAVMWVLKYVLGLPDEYLVAPVDERRGQFLYEEIMQGGNFGQYDKRVKHSNNFLQRNLNRLKQDMRLVHYFPSECLWEPVFRSYHWIWRLRYN